MIDEDIFNATPAARPRWWQRRRQRRLARLLARRAMSNAALGILTVDNVRRMYGLPVKHGSRLNAVMFGLAALEALTSHTPGVPYDSTQFGPIGEALPWVHAFLSAAPSNEAEPAAGLETTIVWGEDCDKLLRTAQRRYSRTWRTLQGAERWLKDMSTSLPILSRGFVAIVSWIIGLMMGWLLHRGR